MSFAICVCGDHFSVTMADGRMMRLSDNTIVTETAIKAIKINDNVSLGVTGDPIPIEVAINSLRNYNYSNLNALEIRSLLIKKLKTLNINNLGVKIIISGKDSSNRFLIDIIDSKKNYTSSPIYPQIGHIATAYAGNNEMLCKTIVNNNFENKTIYNADELEELMKNCILEVAALDPTVNTNIYKVVIF